MNNGLERVLDRVRTTLVQREQSPPVSPEDIQRLAAEEQAARARRWAHHREQQWRSVVAGRGERYADCSLDSFACSLPIQRDVVAALEAYAAELVTRRLRGGGVLMIGPSGTGKDHLLLGVARRLIDRDTDPRVRWTTGVDLYGEARDRIGGEQSERSWLRAYCEPDVLILSDPVPPVVEGRGRESCLTDWQAAVLYRVVDARYASGRPTWASVNVESASEARTRLSSPIVDRLRAESLVCLCHWPSHRRPARVVGAAPTES